MQTTCYWSRDPNPGPRTSGGPWPVRNRATQQEGSSRRANEASSATPHHSHYRLNHHPSPTPIRGKTLFHETGPWDRCTGAPKRKQLILFLEIWEYSKEVLMMYL